MLVYPFDWNAGLDYVFANYVGIWLASTTILVIYAAARRNRPWLPQGTAILPALLSGALWAIAQSAWFVANAALGEPITFPIITTCPALIATICGMVFFKEITVTNLFLNGVNSGIRGVFRDVCAVVLTIYFLTWLKAEFPWVIID